MKLKKIMVTAALSLAVLGAVGTVAPAKASAYDVTVCVSYVFDWNTYVGGMSNFRNYQYKSIPNTYVNKGYQDFVISTGWNYQTEQRVFYWRAN